MGRLRRANKGFKPKLKKIIEKRKEVKVVKQRVQEKEARKELAATRKEQRVQEEQEDLAKIEAEKAWVERQNREFERAEKDIDELAKEVEAELDAEGEDEAESDAEEGASEHAPSSSKQRTLGEREVLTLETLEMWQKEVVDNRSPKALKHLVAAFRDACYINEEEVETEEEAAAHTFRIADSAVFNGLMVFCLKHMDTLLDDQLGWDRFAEKKNNLPTSSKLWQKWKSTIKSYCIHLTKFLAQLSEPKMVSFVLRQIEKMVPYYAPFDRVCRKLLKTLLKVWSTTEDDTVRILSFLAIYKMATTVPYPFINTVLKASYLAFYRHSAATNAVSLPRITFMQNSLVELFSLDHAAAYQHAFVYLRSLAIKLRQALTEKTKESFAAVYNWPFFHSLRLWTKLLCATLGRGANADEPLRLLEYPLVQIVSGTARLVMTQRYLPARFACCRMLNELAAATGTYIPIAPLLLDVVDAEWLRKRPSAPGGSAKHSVDFVLALKAHKKDTTTRAFQEAAFSNLIEVLTENLAVLSTSIAFPEVALPVVFSLKKFSKNTKNAAFRRQISLLLERITATSKFIEERRNRVDYGPKDVDKVDSFLAAERAAGLQTPLEKYWQHFKKLAEQRIVGELKARASDEPTGAGVDDDNFTREREEEENGEEGSDEGDMEMDDMEQKAHKAKPAKKRTRDQLTGTKAEHDEEEDMPKAKKVKASHLPNGTTKKQKKKEKNKHHQVDEEKAATEDVVEDLVLSD